MNIGRKEYKLLWLIENFSYSWHKNGEVLRSPVFTIDRLEGTAWYLMLYPRGYKPENSNSISLFLTRFTKDAGPKFFSVKYELSLLGTDGSTISVGDLEYTAEASIGRGSCRLVQRDEILLRRKVEYLPKDTLTVCCRMWKGEGPARNVGQISARTRILIESYSFLQVVEDFSILQPNIRKTINIQSYSKKGCVISCRLYFNNEGCIMIEITPSGTEHILKKCDLSLLDRFGNMIECGGADYRHLSARMSIHKFHFPLTKEVILSRKDEYLPDNRLSLLYECSFSTRLVSAAIEEVLHELPLPLMKLKTNHVLNNDEYKTEEAVTQYRSAMEDMKAIYLNQYLTDVELRTKTKSFPAHKNVLCARSPVFKAMLTSDRKETNPDCIRMDDYDDDTVEQLLLFLYSDNLNISEWKNASQLYYAAAKYQIEKLKALSSTFLAKNLSISNACEILLLADTHNDGNFKNVVEDFIVEHEEQVFISNGWEKLIEKNPLLVIKTMQLKYKRKYEARNKLNNYFANGR